MICDGQTDRRTDRGIGKNNMSPDPEGGRHNLLNLANENTHIYKQENKSRLTLSQPGSLVFLSQNSVF